MSSPPPPLPRTNTPAPPADRPKAPLLLGAPVVAATAVAVALVVCVVSWIVTHPHKTNGDVAPEPFVVVTGPGIDIEPAPLPPTRPASPVEMTPAVHRPRTQQKKVAAEPQLIVEAPPPLAPPPHSPSPPEEKHPEVPAAAEKDKDAAPAPAGEMYGTQVLFYNNPDAAADLARREKKLMFVMHISGNFEDSCFT